MLHPPCELLLRFLAVAGLAVAGASFLVAELPLPIGLAWLPFVEGKAGRLEVVVLPC